MIREESLGAQQTLRTLNEYLMDMYRQGKLKQEKTNNNYRCGDCRWWKESGMVCTKLYVHAGDLAKKCKYFELKKEEKK